MEHIDITPIIVSVITSGGGIIGAYLAVRKGNREQREKDIRKEQKYEDAMDTVYTQLNEVKERLDKHNGYAEMFYQNQKDLELLQNDVGYIKKRLDGIEMCRIK